MINRMSPRSGRKRDKRKGGTSKEGRNQGEENRPWQQISYKITR